MNNISNGNTLTINPLSEINNNNTSNSSNIPLPQARHKKLQEDVVICIGK